MIRYLYIYIVMYTFTTDWTGVWIWPGLASLFCCHCQILHFLLHFLLLNEMCASVADWHMSAWHNNGVYILRYADSACLIVLFIHSISNQSTIIDPIYLIYLKCTLGTLVFLVFLLNLFPINLIIIEHWCQCTIRLNLLIAHQSDY